MTRVAHITNYGINYSRLEINQGYFERFLTTVYFVYILSDFRHHARDTTEA